MSLYANKKLGQHFLCNENAAILICSDFAKKAQSIIEVGPGRGILTKKLIALDLPVLAVEKDTFFKRHLCSLLKEDQIIWGDALKVDLDNIFPDKEKWLVSNLPYNTATPLLIKFLKVPNISMMTLMFQKEVGLKIVETMGSLKALCNTYFHCRPLIEVPAKDFNPPPKVDSLVVSFERKKRPQIPLDQFNPFEKFLRMLFSKKRKQVFNVLKSHYEKEVIEQVLQKMDVDHKIRAETFDLKLVQQLYSRL